MQCPRFLFIITLPYSGSTAIAKLLNSIPNSMFLQRIGEGQWLVPSLCDKDRWNPDKAINWKLVRKAWLGIYNTVNQLVGTINVIIEKSPPNMVRIKKLLAVFPNSSCFAVMRDPYASCSSFLYREYPVEKLASTEREAALARIAGMWLLRSRYVMEGIQENDLLFFSYEEFCANTGECIKKVTNICPELGAVDCTSTIKVKDYPAQKIINQNARQIERLSKEDINCVSGVLSAGLEQMDYFGYTVR